jgi:hypothetical protein
MMIYKIITNNYGKICAVDKFVDNNQVASIPTYADNTDYANFKTTILEDKAQLQDADGNTMTAQAAKDFIKELP